DKYCVFRAKIGGRLGTNLAVAETFAHTGPGRGFLGRHEAVLAAGGRAVGDSLEFLDPGSGDSLNLAGCRLYHMKILAVSGSTRPGCRARGRGGCLSDCLHPQSGSGARSRDRQRHSLQKFAPAGLSGSSIHFWIMIFRSHIGISLNSVATLHFFGSLALMNLTTLSRYSFGM